MTNIIHSLKTAGIVFGLSWTLHSCVNGNRELSDSERSEISRICDSIVNSNPEYKISKKIIVFCDLELQECKKLNKDIAKKSASNYIDNNISNFELKNRMDSVLKQDNAVYISNNFTDFVWFNDVMLYLSGQYSDAQLLDKGFFEAVKDNSAKKSFEKNTNNILILEKTKNSALNYVNRTDSSVWKRCVKEYKKQR